MISSIKITAKGPSGPNKKQVTQSDEKITEHVLFSKPIETIPAAVSELRSSHNPRRVQQAPFHLVEASGKVVNIAMNDARFARSVLVKACHADMQSAMKLNLHTRHIPYKLHGPRRRPVRSRPAVIHAPVVPLNVLQQRQREQPKVPQDHIRVIGQRRVHHHIITARQ